MVASPSARDSLHFARCLTRFAWSVCPSACGLVHVRAQDVLFPTNMCLEVPCVRLLESRSQFVFAGMLYQVRMRTGAGIGVGTGTDAGAGADTGTGTGAGGGNDALACDRTGLR